MVENKLHGQQQEEIAKQVVDSDEKIEDNKAKENTSDSRNGSSTKATEVKNSCPKEEKREDPNEAMNRALVCTKESIGMKRPRESETDDSGPGEEFNKKAKPFKSNEKVDPEITDVELHEPIESRGQQRMVVGKNPIKLRLK